MQLILMFLLTELQGSAEHHTAGGKTYLNVCMCKHTHTYMLMCLFLLVLTHSTLFNHRNFILMALSKPINLPFLPTSDVLARQLDSFHPLNISQWRLNYNITERGLPMICPTQISIRHSQSQLAALLLLKILPSSVPPLLQESHL